MRLASGPSLAAPWPEAWAAPGHSESARSLLPPLPAEAGGRPQAPAPQQRPILRLWATPVAVREGHLPLGLPDQGWSCH